MEKKQFIEIAKAGFPERIFSEINLDDFKMHHMSGVYRLYHKDVEFIFVLPKCSLLTIFIGAEKFIQISPYSKAFNHYAAIKKMEELELI